MKIISIILSSVLLILSTNAQANDLNKPAIDYVCASEQVAGFKFNGEWQATEFENSKNIYVLKFSKYLKTNDKIDVLKSSYKMNIKGNNISLECIKRLDGIFCGQNFVMTTQTMRFTKFNLGFTNDNVEKLKQMNHASIPNSYIEIGSCSIL